MSLSVGTLHGHRDPMWVFVLSPFSLSSAMDYTSSYGLQPLYGLL